MSLALFGIGKSRHFHGLINKLLIAAFCCLLLVGTGCHPTLSARSGLPASDSEYSSAHYYAEVDSSSVNRLRQSLHYLIKKHRVLSYRSVWSALEAIEQTDSGSGAIKLFYSRRVMSADDKASGKHQAENDYWNREHVWPQSRGIKKTSAKTDLHNIVAADRSINASRGNKYFDVGGKSHRECRNCRSDRNSWEPPDEIKGDVARMLFYMELRYEGNDSSGVGDLQLVDKEQIRSRNQLGSLSTLLKWHCQDSVSAYEIRRNNIINELQGNRNPFIDVPVLVSMIYGRDC